MMSNRRQPVSLHLAIMPNTADQRAVKSTPIPIFADVSKILIPGRIPLMFFNANSRPNPHGSAIPIFVITEPRIPPPRTEHRGNSPPQKARPQSARTLNSQPNNPKTSGDKKSV